MAKEKKLKLKDINRNGYVEKRHTISKLKKQETKYTVFLVMFFMIMFCIIGYNILSFNDDVLVNNVEDEKLNGNISFFSPLVTLNDNSKMADEKGKLLMGHNIKIDNRKEELLNYKIIFQKDDNFFNECGCMENEFDLNNIKFTINNKNILNLNNEMVIKSGRLASGESEEILVKMWVDEKYNSINKFHYHGHFVLKEIKD